MQQKSIGRLIYKLDSKLLRDAKWSLTLPLSQALHERPDDVVALNDSQCLRFIDEINGICDITAKAKEIQRQIRRLKRLPKSRENKKLINTYYDQLYFLQFQPNYVCIVMRSFKDYDRANQGFSINFGIVNGREFVIHYRRLLGTNGGIKNSTIVYVNSEIYPELKKRLDNGRDKTKELVPAKLEAYQALICSGSIPLPKPKGIIVVQDCITHFVEDVIRITDDGGEEPVLTHEHDYEFEHNNSDGYGMMLPSYSRRVNEYLTGDGEHTISGMNTRHAWTKGMVYTFDFVEFAERVAGTYEIEDVWGTKRDVREAEVILTESMLKLWDSYASWEDYERNCEENHYQFAVTKTTPQELEHVRDMNYQFLQSYDFTDDEIVELCKPTVDEIKDVIGLDYRKSIVFLCGFGLNEHNAWGPQYADYAKALMAEPEMIKDPFIRRKIYNAIKTRIAEAKRGCIRVHANYAMIGGDIYALAQHMFGLEVTGLLNKGEVYHKYWIDREADEIVNFRAPMSCHPNIRRMKLNKSDEAAHWFQYIDTALLYNAWDSACEAMNGADFDGDSNMSTDNPILLRKTRNDPTIVCVQRRAEKRVPTESDIIQANKLAFNDDIGKITNYVTSMYDVQACFEAGSPEYEEMSYRIMCGQLFQQNTIDRAKGIIAKPMPEYWYNARACKTTDQDSHDDIAQKKHWMKLVANRKPYFMGYVYPSLLKESRDFEKRVMQKLTVLFQQQGITDIDQLLSSTKTNREIAEFKHYYHMLNPVSKNQCTMNRLAWILEKEFAGIQRQIDQQINCECDFDFSIMQFHGYYTESSYRRVVDIFQNYLNRVIQFKKQRKIDRGDAYSDFTHHLIMKQFFESECYRVCPNEDDLCDIVLDMCYRQNQAKHFAWYICGDVILSNLVDRNNGYISFPVLSAPDEASEFYYCGYPFHMQSLKIGGQPE